MRLLFVLLLGLVVGAVAANMVGNTLRLRHAYTRGVMAVMQHHLAALQDEAHGGQCPAATTMLHLRRMQAASTDILPAFGAGVDAGFHKHADRLHDALGQALRQTPADCPALAAAAQRIGDTCDACHRIYR
ncbi:MAG TPA: cytochrome C [Rhodanobacteraceae bacterium]|nr:cytochrome C [Rhodanobacteraceae bacterium]